jgi:hypothetical protein
VNWRQVTDELADGACAVGGPDAADTQWAPPDPDLLQEVLAELRRLL